MFFGIFFFNYFCIATIMRGTILVFSLFIVILGVAAQAASISVLNSIVASTLKTHR